MEKKRLIKSYIFWFLPLISIILILLNLIGKGLSFIIYNSIFISILAGGLTVFFSFLILIVVFEKSNNVFFSAYMFGIFIRGTVFAIFSILALKFGLYDFFTVALSFTGIYLFFLGLEVIFFKLNF
ncbi:MAG: hypothetical protein ABII27_00550 [bacterium]